MQSPIQIVANALAKVMCCRAPRNRMGYEVQREKVSFVQPVPWSALRNSLDNEVVTHPNLMEGVKLNPYPNQRQLIAVERQERMVPPPPPIHQLHPEEEPMLKYHVSLPGERLECEDKAMEQVSRSSCCCSCFRWVCCALCIFVEVAFAVCVAVAICASNASSDVADLLAPPSSGALLGLPNMSAMQDAGVRVANPWTDQGSGLSFGLLNASEAPGALFRATLRHESNKSKQEDPVPENLRGVFWMRGSAAPQVLVSFQHGTWHPSRQVLLVPKTPVSSAWYGGPRLKPPRAVSGHGWLYKLVGGRDMASASSRGLLSMSFEPCPAWSGCTEAPSNSSLKFASLQAHPDGEPKELEQLSRYLSLTMEEVADPAAGSRWRVRAAALCGNLDIGGFELVRVVDAGGSKVHPHHGDFEQYMNGQPAIVWSD